MLELRYVGGKIYFGKDVQRPIGDPQNLVVPMLLIVIFVIVEIWPIWHVLDNHFIDFLLEPEYLLHSKDIVEGLLKQDRLVLNLNKTTSNALS